jgi:hypothetical protein
LVSDLGDSRQGAQFGSAVLGAVDDGLLVCGEVVRYALHYSVEANYHVKREQIQDRIEDFHKAIGELCGYGGRVTERLIAKSIYSRLGLDFVEHKEWTLVEYAKDAKKEIERRELGR